MEYWTAVASKSWSGDGSEAPEKGFCKAFQHPNHPVQSPQAGRSHVLQAQHAPFQSTIGHITSPTAFPAWRKLCVPSAMRPFPCFVLLCYLLSQVPEADPHDAFPAFDFQMSWDVRRIQAELALRRCSTALACSPRRAVPKEHSLLTVTICEL